MPDVKSQQNRGREKKNSEVKRGRHKRFKTRRKRRMTILPPFGAFISMRNRGGVSTEEAARSTSTEVVDTRACEEKGHKRKPGQIGGRGNSKLEPALLLQ